MYANVYYLCMVFAKASLKWEGKTLRMRCIWKVKLCRCVTMCLLQLWYSHDCWLMICMRLWCYYIVCCYVHTWWIKWCSGNVLEGLICGPRSYGVRITMLWWVVVKWHRDGWPSLCEERMGLWYFDHEWPSLYGVRMSSLYFMWGSM